MANLLKENAPVMQASEAEQEALGTEPTPQGSAVEDEVRHIMAPPGEACLAALELHTWYGSFLALKPSSMMIPRNTIVALIGPSGCGKSTFLRCLNRMNDVIPGFRLEGDVQLDGQSLYTQNVDPVELRKRVGMVFQKPNPFPMSIFDNVAYGPRIHGEKRKAVLAETVEESLKGAALWDEVKDKLNQSGLGLSGGQQQRLCIARTLAVKPEVILMDEPCSALDPIATLRIEDLMVELKAEYTLVIVTHNMQQAGRVSDYTGVFWVDEGRSGVLIEYGRTDELFTNPRHPRTEAYISGRMG